MSSKSVSTVVVNSDRSYSLFSIIKTSIRVICKVLFLVEDGVDKGSEKIRSIDISSLDTDCSK